MFPQYQRDALHPCASFFELTLRCGADLGVRSAFFSLMEAFWHHSGHQKSKYKLDLPLMLYTKENYPSIMEDLPEKVRKKAISLTNEMIHDNNVRYHEDFIIIMAMERAKQWAEIQN